jgi:hypothetical protein
MAMSAQAACTSLLGLVDTTRQILDAVWCGSNYIRSLITEHHDNNVHCYGKKQISIWSRCQNIHPDNWKQVDNISILSRPDNRRGPNLDT